MAVAEAVKIPLAELVDLVGELLELLEEAVGVLQLVEGAERKQRVAQPEFAQAAVPEDPAQVERQTRVAPAAAMVGAVAVAVNMAAAAPAEMMTVEAAAAAVLVSEIR